MLSYDFIWYEQFDTMCCNITVIKIATNHQAYFNIIWYKMCILMFRDLCIYIYSYQWLRVQDFIPSGCVVWRRTLWIAPCPGQNGSFVALEAVLLLVCVCGYSPVIWEFAIWKMDEHGLFIDDLLPKTAIFHGELLVITKRWGNEKQGPVHPQNRHGLKFPWERTPKWRDQIPNQCFVCVLFDIGRDFIEHL